MPSGSAADREPAGVRARLREFDNPFDDFVEPRHARGDFGKRHVPEVNQDAYDVLQRALRRYGEAGHATGPAASEPPRSGVLVVFGPRGSGKTHLLHALQADASATVVAPAHYDPRRPFEEYLLHQLVRTLQEDLDEEDGRLRSLSDWFASQALEQALPALSHRDWLAHLSTAGVSFWKPRFGAPVPQTTTADTLLGQLHGTPKQSPLDVVEGTGLPPGAIRTLLHRHVDRFHRGQTPDAKIECALLHHLVEFAFGGPSSAISEYLVDEFTQVEIELQPTREDLVDGLFQALTRLLLLAGKPVLFAFDSLETLLRDPPDLERCQAFTSSLADAIDGYRGVMYVVLAELRYYQALSAAAKEFAQQRIEQGMPLGGAGSRDTVSLETPRSHQVEAIVRRRMAPYVEHVLGDDVRPADQLLPFSAEDIRSIAREDDPPPLRQVLQALRARYHELVFAVRTGVEEPTPAVATPTPVAAEPTPDNRLERIWTRSVRRAARLVSTNPPSAYADDLLTSLEGWLNLFIGDASDDAGPRLDAVKLELEGSHPTYGQYVRCRLRSGGRATSVGVGFLLGQRRGMPRDLQTKLDLVDRADPAVEHLLVLWPRPDKNGTAEEQLAPSTKQTWTRFREGARGHQATLKVVGLDDVAAWLAHAGWESELRAEEPPLPPEMATAHIRARTAHLWQLVRQAFP